MAITYNKIIESTTEPATNNLWLKDGKLYYYKGGWKPLTSEENMSTEDLKLLISEYSDGRQAIATALTNRKYPTEPSESFHAMADKITNMSYEEGWFAKIGYTDENDDGIKEAIDYSYELAKGWNPDGSTRILFRDNTLLIFAPYVDTSGYNNLSDMYYGCTKLSFIPALPTKGVLDFSGCFYSTNIQENPKWDYSNTLSLSSTFQLSKVVKIKGLIAPKCTSYNSTFSNCSYLTEIDYLDVGEVSGIGFYYMVQGCSKLVFMRLVNLGKSTLTSLDVSSATNWGTGSEENRQSLIDSLITYSYDRANAGMANFTIKLSANTKALLTEEEVAQITAKGFTIA